jgi:hypothetical protein
MSDRINDKLDDISVKVARIEVTLERNTDDLSEHMRRTELLEKKATKVEAIMWTLGAIYTIINLGLAIWKVIP